MGDVASGQAQRPADGEADALLRCLREYPLSADLQISAFSASIQHYRRASVATPFPSHLFQTSKGEKDYKAVQQALQRLTSVATLLHNDPQRHPTLPPAARELLRWLLTPDNRRSNTFSPVHPEQFVQHISSPHYQQNSAASGKSTVPPDFRIPVEVPTAILQRLPDASPSTNGSTAAVSSTAFAQPVIAFHGTCFENLHSILNTGLVNVSATRATMQRNGAIFGAGIYLSTRFDVAFSFSKPAATWRHSCLGSSCRCLLVCEVDMSKVSDAPSSATASPSAPSAAQGSGSHGAAASAPRDRGGGGDGSGSASSSSSALPESYLLVTRPDAIRLLYVLVYREQGPQTGRAGGLVPHWPTVVVGFYLVFILVQWMMHNRQVQVQLRRWWRQVVAEGPDAHVPAWQRWQ